MPTIFVATTDGVATFDEQGRQLDVAHAGRSVTALGRMRDDVWAIVDAAELWHASQSSWADVAGLDGGLRATCVAGIGGVVFVGTSEARLFRFAGETLEPVRAFDDAEGREAWYTPWGGPPDTRSIANWNHDIYVNVHVGGILGTDDGGTWTPTIDIDADVHQVTTAEGLVLAACAGGLAVSTDRGVTWTYRTDGLDARYSRAVAVCGDAVLVSASNGPRGGNAAVYRAGLGAGAFERCVAGLPASFDDNIDTYCLDALPDGSFAAFGTSDGSVYASTDQGAVWDGLATGLRPVQRVLVMP